MARRENGGLVASPGTPASAEVISESAEVERMIAAERQSQHNSMSRPEHDQTLFNAIEALADSPGLADQLQDVLKGESFLLF
ncbi:MAG: hypothetical protein RI971_75, partial [Chloroflexota bacterium]